MASCHSRCPVRTAIGRRTGTGIIDGLTVESPNGRQGLRAMTGVLSVRTVLDIGLDCFLVLTLSAVWFCENKNPAPVFPYMLSYSNMPTLVN